MAGVQISLVAIGLDAAQRAVAAMARDPDGELMLTVTELVANQTKERIDSEKASPAGAAWPAWSADYAGSRHGGQSLLVADGHLQGSIASFASGNEGSVGSGLAYAAIHNFGGEDMPQREFLGLSAENRDEVEGIVRDYFLDLVS